MKLRLPLALAAVLMLGSAVSHAATVIEYTDIIDNMTVTEDTQFKPAGQNFLAIWNFGIDSIAVTIGTEDGSVNPRVSAPQIALAA